MKKHAKIICTVLVILMAVMNLPLAALAEGPVDYGFTREHVKYGVYFDEYQPDATYLDGETYGTLATYGTSGVKVNIVRGVNATLSQAEGGYGLKVTPIDTSQPFGLYFSIPAEAKLDNPDYAYSSVVYRISGATVAGSGQGDFYSHFTRVMQTKTFGLFHTYQFNNNVWQYCTIENNPADSGLTDNGYYFFGWSNGVSFTARNYMMFPVMNTGASITVSCLTFAASAEAANAESEKQITFHNGVDMGGYAPTLDSGIYYSAQKVSIRKNNDVEVYYTTDGTIPSKTNGTLYTGEMNVNNSVEYRFVGIRGDKTGPVIVRNYEIRSNACMDPVFSGINGAYVPSGTLLTITTGTADATIYYTTDGTLPTAQSNVYTGPIRIFNAMVIRAIAKKDGLQDSNVKNIEVKSIGATNYVWRYSNVTYSQFINETHLFTASTWDMLAISDPNAANNSENALTIALGDSMVASIGMWIEAERINGLPCSAYPYLKIGYKSTADLSLKVNADWAMTYKSGTIESDYMAVPKSADYSSVVLDLSESMEKWDVLYNGLAHTRLSFYAGGQATPQDSISIQYVAFFATEEAANAFSTIAAPIFSVRGGDFTEEVRLEISSTTEGAKIYYTTDGSTPTTQSTEYTAPVSIISPETVVNAIAVKDGVVSGLASDTYNVVLKAATPTFSVPAGKYTEAIEVEILCATEGAVIYYTTDGSVPSASNGELYLGSFTVEESCILRAIAIVEGMGDSKVSAANYKIDLSAKTEDTTLPVTGEQPTQPSVTDDKPDADKGGCRSAIGLGTITAIVAVIGSALLVRRKED